MVLTGLPLLPSLFLCVGETGLKKQFNDVFKLVSALWGPGEGDEERGEFCKCCCHFRRCALQSSVMPERKSLRCF